ncbi:MAG: hypothetical protein JXA97_13090 [Anaerolineales bacterium]|nr:hypothetical protein [Anaerolineales bacterium]
MSSRSKAILAATAVLLATLACARAGEVVSPAEATRRVEATQAAVLTPDVALEAIFGVNSTVEFIGEQYLIPLQAEPGDVVAESHVPRGEFGIVLGSELLDGEVWYFVDSTSGQGWIREESLQASETAEATGPQVGDTVYLIGLGYLINLADQPGSNLIAANQERGAEVIIEAITQFEGEVWYLVDAPTGEGWIRGENISIEAP